MTEINHQLLSHLEIDRFRHLLSPSGLPAYEQLLDTDLCQKVICSVLVWFYCPSYTEH